MYEPPDSLLAIQALAAASALDDELVELEVVDELEVVEELEVVFELEVVDELEVDFELDEVVEVVVDELVVAVPATFNVSPT